MTPASLRRRQGRHGAAAPQRTPSPRWRGERLSGLSSGMSELTPDVAGFGVEADEKFAGERHADNHFWLTGGGEPAVELAKIGIVPAHDLGHDVQDGADAGAAAAHSAFAVTLAAVAGDRGKT